MSLCSFWPGGRAKLWEEKLGLAEKFAGNSATVWGTNVEPEALERYMEVTGHIVESKSFQVYGDSLVTAWLGASPDGLIPTSDAQDMEYTGLQPYLVHRHRWLSKKVHHCILAFSLSRRCFIYYHCKAPV